MALRFVESFDHEVQADMITKWAGWIAPGGISTSIYRTGRASVSKPSDCYLIFDPQPTWVVGFAFRLAWLGGWPDAIIALCDGLSTTLQCELRYIAPNRFRITRNNNTVATSEPLAGLSAGVWYYLELKVTIGDAGTYELRLNGDVVVMAGTGDLQNTTNASANIVKVGYPYDTAADMWCVDDLYICDGTGGAPNNTFLGDSKVLILRPNADGSSQQWTPSGAGAHYLMTDELTPNGDTDYISAGAAAETELQGFQALPGDVGLIRGVQLVAQYKKDDAAARVIALQVKSGASVAQTPNISPPTSYVFGKHMVETDPATGAAWTAAAVNAVEAGATVIS